MDKKIYLLIDKNEIIETGTSVQSIMHDRMSPAPLDSKIESIVIEVAFEHDEKVMLDSLIGNKFDETDDRISYELLRVAFPTMQDEVIIKIDDELQDEIMSYVCGDQEKEEWPDILLLRRAQEDY